MSTLAALHASAPRRLQGEAKSFILPGIDDDLKVWKPLQDLLDPIIIDYLDWTELLDMDLATLAAYVAVQIESAQPSGEIRLVGYSIGGSLGFAVTMALHAVGRRVSHLVLVDASAETYARSRSLGRQARERLQQLAKLFSIDGISSLVAKLLSMQSMLPLLRSLVRWRRKKLPFGFDSFLHRKLTIQLMRKLYWPWWSTILASGHSLATPTILFRSEDHEPMESEDLGWRNFCTNLTVIPLAASHTTIMEPAHVGRISAEVQAAFHAG